MSSMIERVAAVLRGPGASCFMNQRDSLDMARDVIKEMREVTEEMAEAMRNAEFSADARYADYTCFDAWEAGIDAALGGKDV